MKNKRNYLVEDEFFGEGVKVLFTKKSLFSSSFFLMMNRETSESFQRLELLLNKEEGIVIKNLFVPNAEQKDFLLIWIKIQIGNTPFMASIGIYY